MLRAATGRRASAGGPFAARDGARSTGPTPVASAPTRCTRGGASMPLVRDTVPAIRASTALATNITGEPRAFAALAVTVWLLVPTVLPTVSVALARPLPFVVVLAGDALPPPVAPRADCACPDRGRGARAHLQRVERLPRPQDRAHRELLHPDRRPLDHDLPRPRPNLDPREQHRTDDGLGVGLGGRRRRVYHSGDPADGLRLGHQPGGGPGHGRRADGRADDDPVAPRVDREGARHADLSGGDGLRRGTDRR